jgi:hypothetical protein
MKPIESSDEMFHELSTEWADLSPSLNAQFRGYTMRVLERMKRDATTDRDVFAARVFMAGIAKVIEGAGEVRAARVESN